MNLNIEELKYPIGKFEAPLVIDENQIQKWIKSIEAFPKKLDSEIEKLTLSTLEKKHRPNGWTITQIIHHCADASMNGIIRFKLALTEEKPTIKPFEEQKWAELLDGKSFPIASSLKIIEGIHQKWVILLNSLSESDFERVFFHPEKQIYISLKEAIGMSAWHYDHHLAHIKNAKELNF